MHKLFVASLILAFVTLGWSACSLGQEVSTPQGELRIVDKSPVNWISMTFNVFEHLVEADPLGSQYGLLGCRAVSTAATHYL